MSAKKQEAKKNGSKGKTAAVKKATAKPETEEEAARVKLKTFVSLAEIQKWGNEMRRMMLVESAVTDCESHAECPA